MSLSVGRFDECVGDESGCHSNSFPTSFISLINQSINTEKSRLRGPKPKYLPLAAKRYNCKICNKGLPSTLALYGHMHSHKFCLSRPQPLPPGVRYARTTLNLIHERNSNLHRGPKPKYLPLAAKLYNCKICNKGFPSTRAMYGHKHAHKVRPTRSQLLPHGVRYASTTLKLIL
ncbi:hypothetical protein Pyn_18476 [Prunus yedoensis var. nudiflora]|uniref:C2H2-type domain-containing protein n=1 Tax=Prunus yedoensis var. nudiflora TaxID=2094558 RepID=A0A315A0N9_PRUYE|nr:hypothetical protein Pyn_18476 [Prunus yedoensis var. nudiflora]